MQFTEKRENRNRVNSFLTIFALLLLPLIFPCPAAAHSISPTVINYITQPGKSDLSNVTFRNDSETTIQLDLYVAPYDPKQERILKGETFISLPKQSVSVGADESVQIPFQLSIPADMADGTYFNIVYAVVRENEQSVGSSVGFKHGLGTIVAVHNYAKEDILGAFSSLSQLQIELLDRGIPLIRPAKAVVSYINLTDYTIYPTGELRVLNRSNRSVINNQRFNQSDVKAYPGDTILQTYQLDIWQLEEISDLPRLFEDRTLVARVYSQFGSNYIEDETIIKGLPYSYLLIPALLVILLGIAIYKVAKWIYSKRKA